MKVIETYLRPVLYLLLACQIAAATYFMSHLLVAGYLPAPFIYDKSNTFMDLYHPMFWALDPARYTDWLSVYPPINFLILGGARLLTFGAKGFSDAFALRDQSQWISLGFVASAYASLWASLPKKLLPGADHKLILLVLIGLSPPFLFAIERGNILVLLLPLVTNAVFCAGWKRALAIALLINFKPYFAVLLLVYALKGEVAWGTMAALLTVAIFLATGLALDPNFPILFSNFSSFNQVTGATSPGNYLAMSSSLDSIVYAVKHVLLTSSDGRFWPTRDIEFLASLLGAINHATIIALLAVAAAKAPAISYREMLLACVLIILNFSVSAGGYSLVFLAPFIPVILRLRLRSYAIVALCLVFLPTDLLISFPFDRHGEMGAFLSGRTVLVQERITLGAITHPLGSFALVATLLCEFAGRRALSVERDVLNQHEIETQKAPT